MQFNQAVVAFALLGPPLVGIVAPIVSFLHLRAYARSRGKLNGSRRRSLCWLVVVLFIWTILSVGTSILFQNLAFGYAWGWAHVNRPVPIRDEAMLLTEILLGVTLLGSFGFVLHRVLAATLRRIA